MTEPATPPATTPAATQAATPAPAPGDRIAELEARLAEMEAQTTQRLIQSDLKTHALRAGMIDLDGLRMLDTRALKLDSKGEVEGVAAVMAELKRSKPYLFQPATTTSLSSAPPYAPPSEKRATAMTHDEWQAARAALLKRR
jgi:hypothetical protein